MPIARLRTLARVIWRARRRDDRVRLILADTLYAQPASMAFSAAGGMSASLFSALITPDRAITLTAALVGAVALLRFAVVLAVPRLRGRANRVARGLFEGGAFVYATAVGVLAALAILKSVSVEAQLLMVGFAICYGAGISARNAGNPGLAIGQMVLALTLPAAALLLRGGPHAPVLAASLAIMIPAMASITLYMHKVLRRSMAMAEASRRLAERMQAAARTDVLTGLRNRAGLNADLAARIAATAPDDRLALLWLDLDRFKEVNDLLGHQTGDRLLAEVASRLRRTAPDGAILARFGGDEFIIACPAMNREAVGRLAQTILHEIASPFPVDGHRLEIGGSIGMALLPDDGRSMDAVMQAADVALHHAKTGGRGKASHFDPRMTRTMARRREIEADLRRALDSDELAVFYQPVIDLETGRIRAFEALTRWHHPQQGELSPDEFIPVAEETGSIITLGNWLVARAARTAATWPEDIAIAVNLSPLHIRAPGAAMAILASLRQARLDPRRLIVEITESALLERCDDTDGFIDELGRAGVRFALDDFGTGYSSLASLNAYPFSHIKIDRGFVSGEQAGPKAEAIVRAVAGMAATLGMDVVAEGIETEAQMQALREAGCNLGQGWLYSRAVPASLASLLIARDAQSASPGPRTAHG